jgi:hypothetical protein
MLGTSSYRLTRLSLVPTGAKTKAWCLLIHADASLSLSPSHGGQGGSLVPPHTR